MSSSTGFWTRQRQRLEDFQQLYAKHGVFALSPAIVRLRGQREQLESEVHELRRQHDHAYEKLREQDNRIWMERLTSILQKRA